MNPNNAARFTTPMSPDSKSPQHDEELHPCEPLSPESIASPSPALKLYRFEWATDPYDPTKHLGPPEVAIRNHLFAVEFRISSPEVFNPQVRIYAKVHPDYNVAFHLCTERVTANEWERVALVIPRKGVYGIDVQIYPDRPEFRNGLVKPRYLTTVYDESDGVHAPLGGFEHKILFGGDQGQDENTETTTESNGQSTLEDTQSQGNTDVQVEDDFFAQWLRFSPEP
ncbi:hypothetical protein ZTR_05426 [Talaromyces verruculosus]|nr:hypothetical protein ZTR_05426 [Talaromyces verruculosus]